MSKPLLIAQISDSHVRRPGERLFGAIDTAGAFARAVDHLMAMTPAIDAVIFTGDLVNDGEEADYAALAEMARRLPMPLYPIPGNHDRRELVRTHFAFTGVLPDEGPIAYTADCGPVRLVALDTLVEGEVGGLLGSDQLGWLDDTLARAAERPVLIFLHHPPFASGLAFMDEIGLNDAKAFAAVIARHSNVTLVACGHVHRMIHARVAGVPALAAPGIAHQCVLDLSPEAPGRWITEPPACLIHRWQAGHGFVSHVSYVGRYGDDASFSNVITRVDG